MVQATICRYFQHVCNDLRHFARDSRLDNISRPDRPIRTQHTICSYFGSTCSRVPRESGLLCLSSGIRATIYEYAGLSRGCPIEHSFDEFQIAGDATNLLLVCRRLYREIVTILYSKEKVYIEARNLQKLRDLSPHILSSITCLNVNLNLFRRRSHAASGTRDHSYLADEFDKSSRRHREVLREWRLTLSRISPFLTPSQLSLGLICDVRDAEMGEMCTQSLLCLPRLAKCSIRLKAKPDPHLRTIARTAAARAVGLPEDLDRPFRLFDLPLEICDLILHLTALITPVAEVEWSSTHGFRLRWRGHKCSDPNLSYYPNDVSHACGHDIERCRDPDHCLRKYAATSSSCCCWMPPTDMLLVSRAFRQHALAVFYERNRFILIPNDDRIEDASPIPVKSFLTKTVPDCALGSLRVLEVAFPVLCAERLRQSPSELASWLQPIVELRKKLNLPTLTLRLLLSNTVTGTEHMTYFNVLDQTRMKKHEQKALLDMYAHCLHTLAQLEGLKRFFVYFEFPFPRILVGRRHEGAFTPEPNHEARSEIETILEQCVMGSNYSGARVGKAEQRPSRWQVEWIYYRRRFS